MTKPNTSTNKILCKVLWIGNYVRGLFTLNKRVKELERRMKVQHKINKLETSTRIMFLENIKKIAKELDIKDLDLHWANYWSISQESKTNKDTSIFEITRKYSRQEIHRRITDYENRKAIESERDIEEYSRLCKILFCDNYTITI